jgi:hypothetical protein
MAALLGQQLVGIVTACIALPLQETEHVGGWLDLSGPWPILELAEPLTEALREVSRNHLPGWFGQRVASG